MRCDPMPNGIDGTDGVSKARNWWGAALGGGLDSGQHMVARSCGDRMGALGDGGVFVLPGGEAHWARVGYVWGNGAGDGGCAGECYLAGVGDGRGDGHAMGDMGQRPGLVGTDGGWDRAGDMDHGFAVCVSADDADPS